MKKPLLSPCPVPTLSELEGWIASREARFPTMKPGVAAGIVWANPKQKRQTPLSIVYLPGYTATRGEIAPVPDRIAQTLGANLYYARMTGTGIGPEGHRTVKVQDWMDDGLQAVEIGRRIGERVVLMSTSTGGTLAAWLILGPPRVSVAATILVSPNFTPKNALSELLLWPGKELLLKIFVGKTVSLEPSNALDDQFWDLTHDSHSLIPMMQLVREARKKDFRKWPSPVLGVYDPEDPVVNEAVTERLLSRVPKDLCTQVRWKTGPGDHAHVLAGDAMSPGGTDKMVTVCIDFLNTTLGPTRP